MSNPYIKILIGPPCSGKSTWIKNNHNGEEILSTDDMIEEYARENNSTYTEVFDSKLMSIMTKRFFDLIDECVKDKKNIIIDRTNMKAGARDKILSRVSSDYEKIAVVFEYDKDDLYVRNENRNKETGKFIPKFVISGMCNSFEDPTADEFNSIERIPYG